MFENYFLIYILYIFALNNFIVNILWSIKVVIFIRRRFGTYQCRGTTKKLELWHRVLKCRVSYTLIVRVYIRSIYRVSAN